MVESYPLHWPDGIPREKNPQRSRFKTSVTTAILLIKNEIRLSGCTGLIISTNVPLKQNGAPYANYKIYDAGAAIYYQRKTSTLCLTCDRWTMVVDNLYAIGKTLHSLRSIKRWVGDGEIDRMYTGFVLLGAASEHWSDILDVNKHATHAEVEKAYLSKRSSAHPDKGGDADQFVKIQSAYEQYKNEHNQR